MIRSRNLNLSKTFESSDVLLRNPCSEEKTDTRQTEYRYKTAVTVAKSVLHTTVDGYYSR